MWFFGRLLGFDFGVLSRLIADGRGVLEFGLVLGYTMDVLNTGAVDIQREVTNHNLNFLGLLGTGCKMFIVA